MMMKWFGEMVTLGLTIALAVKWTNAFSILASVAALVYYGIRIYKELNK